MKDQARKLRLQLLEDMSQELSEATELRLKSIAIEIAVDHPEIFAQYWYDKPATAGICDPALYKELQGIYTGRDNPKVPMIKEYRRRTGKGLKEGITFIEEYWTF